MERVWTMAAGAHVGERVCVQGWLHAQRRMGGVNFLVIRDGWGTLQAVTEDEAALAPLGGLTVESVVAVEGTVTSAPQAPGGLELRDLRIEVITPVTEAPPLTLSKRELKANVATLLDHATVAHRHPTRRAVFKLSASAMQSFRSTLIERGFTEIQTPKLVASATESGANVFKLDYFGRPAYLAQSPQLYKQIMVGVFERVFEVGPVFRAEPHDTTRHLNQYVSLDVEFGFIRDHFDVMQVVRDVIAGFVHTFAERNAAELALLNVDLPAVPPTIPHIHFADAQQLIWERHGVDVRGEPDLSPQDERWLGAWAREQHGSDWLFVTGYPMAARPFYTHADPQRPQYSNSFDLLFRGTELVTGGQRLHRYDDYLAALARINVSPELFTGYLQAFKHGMPPHGGFAIGLERLLMQLIGTANVKLTTLFPRDIHRLTP